MTIDLPKLLDDGQGDPVGRGRASALASDHCVGAGAVETLSFPAEFLPSRGMFEAPLAEHLASASDASDYQRFTSQLPFILVFTPHALKLPRQSRTAKRSGYRHAKQGERRGNAGHDGAATVKAAPPARRFAVQEP